MQGFSFKVDNFWSPKWPAWRGSGRSISGTSALHRPDVDRAWPANIASLLNVVQAIFCLPGISNEGLYTCICTFVCM